MQSAKREVQDLLRDLPDDITLEEIQHRIYIKQKVEQGLADIREGRTVSQEEVERRFTRWLDR